MVWGAFAVGGVVGLLVFRALMGIAVAVNQVVAVLHEVAALQRHRLQMQRQQHSAQLCVCGHVRGDHAAGECCNCECAGFSARP